MIKKILLTLGGLAGIGLLGGVAYHKLKESRKQEEIYDLYGIPRIEEKSRVNARFERFVGYKQPKEFAEGLIDEITNYNNDDTSETTINYVGPSKEELKDDVLYDIEINYYGDEGYVEEIVVKPS